MRISVLEHDPGYAAYLQAREQGFDYVVSLNGARVSRCIMADDGAGELLVYASGANGGFVIDHASGECITESRRGRVAITRRWKAKQS